MGFFPLLKNLPPSFDLLIPFYQFENELVRELNLLNVNVLFKNEKIILVPSLQKKPVWAQDWWPATKIFQLESKSPIVKLLKEKPTLGHYYASEDSKIAKSVLKDITNFSKKRIEVNSIFDFKYFTWTYINNALLVCSSPFSRFPQGWHEFNENKIFPPNRAYLKLWELFTVHNLKYEKLDSVLDLGASPGGWSWVLSQYFKKVHAVDKAPLDKKIQKIANIEFHKGDAFKVSIQNFQDCNWLFSDIICTPAKSYALIEYWMKNSNIKNFVCTIKFKGECDFLIINKLLEIDNSKIVHLYQNKNEVTWIKQERLSKND